VNPKPCKVIFDTDPGVDDAMALYFALAHPGIDVIGITTTFGNVTVAQAAINALYLTRIAGVTTIPVTQGVAAPLCIAAPVPPAHIHGADGLGNLLERAPIQAALDPRTSAQFIVDMARAHPGEITLVAVGPLGNLALALAIEPRLPQLLREVILMGGAVLEPGNVSAVAEANIANDPHAAAQVFAANWKLTMVGLDVTHRVILPLALFKKIADKQQHLATTTLYQAVSFYADFYSGLYPHVARIHGCFGHDVLAFLYLVQPELFGMAQGRVSVLTEGPFQGQTVLSSSYLASAALADRRSECISQVCMQVDSDACLQAVEDSLLGRWLA
jgi:inosine-uridine nucleoside N-ribohydrolase